MSIEQVYADQSLYNKHKNTKSSGYLDDEYELSPDFRQIEDYHFRIEDDHEIIELKNLQKHSVPMQTGFNMPSNTSMQFNKKMADLYSALDAAVPMKNGQPVMAAETHGFYKLKDDAYDQQKALEAAYQHLQLNSLNERMQNLTIESKAIKFRSRAAVSNLMKQQKQVMDQQNKQQQAKQSKQMAKLNKQLNKMTINGQQL